MSHRCVWLSWSLLIAGAAAGCQVPTYKLPAGYSSTYARHLNAAEFVTPLPTEIPPPACAPDSPGVFYPQTFLYDPPTKSEHRQAVLVPETRPQSRRRY